MSHLTLSGGIDYLGDISGSFELLELLGVADLLQEVRHQIVDEPYDLLYCIDICVMIEDFVVWWSLHDFVTEICELVARLVPDYQAILIQPFYLFTGEVLLT